MRIDILTLFPSVFEGIFSRSIIGRAKSQGLVQINLVDIRDSASDTRKTVDDTPYGGGAGMVLKVDVLHRALKKTLKNSPGKPYVILLSSSGKKYDQKFASKLAKRDWLVFICGHYEGVDERIKDFIDEEISIGDYVLSGGEIPAMVISDSVVRLIRGVLGGEESLQEESFGFFNIDSQKKKLLEYPQYTHPFEYEGRKVPEVLLSGDHKKIKQWRLKEALAKTQKNRPDLLKKTS